MIITRPRPAVHDAHAFALGEARLLPGRMAADAEMEHARRTGLTYTFHDRTGKGQHFRGKVVGRDGAQWKCIDTAGGTRIIFAAEYELQ